MMNGFSVKKSREEKSQKKKRRIPKRRAEEQSIQLPNDTKKLLPSATLPREEEEDE